MRHVPVLMDEVLASLQLKPNSNVVDCTLGDGGHAEKILAATAPAGKLLGVDADPESILRAKQFLHEFGERVIFVRDNFVGLKDIVAREKFGPVHGAFFDLGWSTPQFEDRRRGFSFLKPAEPLDMRYSQKNSAFSVQRSAVYETAATVVNNESESELARIFREYGEEKLAGEIARAIVAKRLDYKIDTVGDLVDIVLAVYRKKLKTNKTVPWVGGRHPATKVFQALRIAVNDELDALRLVLPQAMEILAPGGRLAVITFHSLEDRIVKHWFKKHLSALRIITKKPIVPSDGEVKQNPRAASAKLRVIEKI